MLLRLAAACYGIAATTVGCMAQDSPNDRSVRIAVERRDPVAVEAALAARRGVEDRDEIGNTPLLIAVGSGQFQIARMLVVGGADIWAHDQFGVTVGRSIAANAYPSGTPEGDAKAALVADLEARGYEVPGPEPRAVLAMAKRGEWPPRPAMQGAR